MATAPLDSPNLPAGFVLKDLASYPPKERSSIVGKVAKIEKKTFPSSEAFDFDAELRKKNTSMIVVIKEENSLVAGYLVYLRMRRLALLHKICVVNQERGKGIGKFLIRFLRNNLEKSGCQNIQLWVDEAREQAKALYKSCEFQQIDSCLDYYGPGRTGLKMQLSVEK